MKKSGSRFLFPLLFLALAGGCSKPALNPILIPQQDLVPADVIVVLGYGPPVDEKGEPADELARRVKAGVQLYRQGLAKKMIMTGGNTYKDLYESSVMKEVAVSMGVPGEDVVEEREAMDTIGNARYSAGIMRERGWSSCIVVSSPYHLKRARHLFKAAGVKVQTSGCEVPDNPFYGLTFTLYELSVRISYAFIDEERMVRSHAGDKHTSRIRDPVRARTKAMPDE